MSDTSEQDVDPESHGSDAKVSEEWVKEQEELRAKIITTDSEPWQIERLVEQVAAEEDSDSGSLDDEGELVSSMKAVNLNTDVSSTSCRPLQYVAGVDLSFLKNNETTACAALVVCRMPDLEVVYEDYRMHEITVPYIAGYLAFRETAPLVEAFQRLKDSKPEYIPQAILVDGNGLLHYREAGLACHLGVAVDIPTVGVAKNLLAVGELAKNEEHREKIAGLTNAGDSFPLPDASGKVLGMALKACKNAQNPVYVSIGHRISLETAIWLVLQCSKFRIPEPIRQADQRSRSFLRDKFPDPSPSQKTKSPSKCNGASTSSES